MVSTIFVITSNRSISTKKNQLEMPGSETAVENVDISYSYPQVRILVTHGVQYLPSTDHVVVMEDGRVTESGHYEKLLAHSGPFGKLITNYLTQEDPDKEVGDEDGTNTPHPL